MGGKSTTQKVNQTVTPTNPSWVTGALQGYTGQVGQWAANTNPRDLVAPASPLQQQAFSQAAAMNGASGQPAYDYFGRAAELGNAGSGSAAGLIGDYMSPYQGQVIDAAMADYDANAGRLRAAQAAQGAANKAFGGSRYGVQEAQTEGELGRGRSGILANLLNQGYGQALSAAQEQRGRELSGAGLFGSLGSAQGADERANIGLLSDLGAQQRGIDANYRTADLSMLQALGQLYGQGQYGLFQGQNQQGTTTQRENPGLLGTVGQTAQTAAALASLFSDRRLKKDIERVGTRPDGLGEYRFRYIWDEDGSPKHDGMMADEIAQVYPNAVSEHESGFLMVDYGAVQ